MPHESNSSDENYRLLSDEEIINKRLAGNKDMYAILVERYKEGILNFIYQIIKDYHTAEDIAQDVFVKAFISLRTLRNKITFSAWLYQIARNKSLDYLKNVRRKELRLETEQYVANFQVSQITTNDFEKKLTKAVNTLPDKYQEAFILKHRMDFSYAQIQDILKVSISSLKVRVHRAREMLLDILREEKE
ncbi:MAG: RNA polymerase sigma factor [Planctomycetota bacterium]